MELPNWVWDEVLLAATPSAVRLACTIYRHGAPVVDANGDRRLYLRDSAPRLARRAGLSRASVFAALAELETAGLLRSHRANRPQAPNSHSVPIDRPTRPTFGRVPEPEIATHDGDRKITSPADSTGTTSTTTTPAPQPVELLDALAAIGVTSPSAWLNRYDHARIRAALDHIDRLPYRGDIRNPAGFAHRLITSPDPIPAPPAPRPPQGPDYWKSYGVRVISSPADLTPRRER